MGLPFDNLAQFFLRRIRSITRIPAFSWLKIQLLLNLARRVPFFRKTGREWETWSDDDDLHPCIENACHAISIDDERMTFHPVLWLEYKSDGTHKKDCSNTLLRDVNQVWFSGVHANVGGGYSKDHLAYVSLEWMMRHATQAGLTFNKLRWQNYHQEKDELGKLYDSRSGGSVFYRYKPRMILDISREVGIDGDTQKPLVHQSVLQRIENSTAGYAPFNAGWPWPMFGYPKGLIDTLYSLHTFAAREFAQSGSVCLWTLGVTAAAAIVDLAAGTKLRKQPGIVRVAFRSIWIGLLGFVLQPLIEEAFALVLPEAVEDVLEGVTSSRILTGSFAAALAGVILVSKVCKSRIREWGLYGWKVSLGHLESPEKPDTTAWESIGEQLPSDSFVSRLLERIILPFGAIGILLLVICLFVSSAQG